MDTKASTPRTSSTGDLKLVQNKVCRFFVSLLLLQLLWLLLLLLPFFTIFETP